MNIRDEIFINQTAQGIVPLDSGAKWFDALDEDRRRSTLREVAVLILQASADTGDVPSAVESAKISAKSTPVVLAGRPPLRTQLAKIANLPYSELPVAFRLFVALLGVADQRRRSRCGPVCAHWWHLDLADKEVIDDLLRREAKS